MIVFATAKLPLAAFYISKGSSWRFLFFFFVSPARGWLLAGDQMLRFKLGEVKKRKKREMSEAGGFYPATSKLGLGFRNYARLHNIADAFPI
jgi:hypothetical protein